jgi:hypothetical protein
MWYGRDGWGWCGVIFNVLAVALFLGVIIAAVALAVHVRGGGQSDPTALDDSGFARAGQAAASSGARDDLGDNEFYHGS